MKDPLRAMIQLSFFRPDFALRALKSRHLFGKWFTVICGLALLRRSTLPPIR